METDGVSETSGRIHQTLRSNTNTHWCKNIEKAWCAGGGVFWEISLNNLPARSSRLQ
jgi:hypothetical protein